MCIRDSTGSTHTYIKLYKIRTGQRKERNMGFTRHCLGKQGFTGSGRAYEKRSLGKLGDVYKRQGYGGSVHD